MRSRVGNQTRWALLFPLLGLVLLLPLALAQQMDLGYRSAAARPKKPVTTHSAPLTTTIPAGGGPTLAPGVKPLTATVSKTLYLPPAMYGQWSVTGSVRETNIEGLIPVANDLWVLQREGDAVTITNPTNGASAQINVDAVQGNTATFHRFGQSGRLARSETVTLTVEGDHLFGKNLRREELSKNGKVVKVNFALFDLQGTRIGGAGAVFRPELRDGEPDIEIEDVRKGP